MLKSQKDRSTGRKLGIHYAWIIIAIAAVMHMAGLARAPEPGHAGSEVVVVALTESGFRHLVGAIAGEFKRPKPIARGLYPDSNFYDARGTFHLFNTCNTWTARMLCAAGVDLSPSGVITANQLMARLRAAIENW